ncbi:hypothetical protein NLX86_04840 [Streptomyces sp. A3M-1-3]|uniref:hypothetical protein n=1 Tax=Streptomyces sp. A3M-1-3 TaxID=2962044 RepID=UPI0020B7113B|nr:hypothetical protein [Streptomyces sp. A3M-1-3]MCP3817486.1 hypothetical protein [Streptomyces sp. A3M-1-3]
MTDARSPMRATRAAVFAAVCVALAAVGHSYMSAHDIPIGALFAAFAVTGTAAWLAGGRRRGIPSIGAGLLAVQGALHLIFGTAQPHQDAHAPHAHTGMASETLTTGAASHSSAGMLVAHLLAALVCALWLAGGEAAAFRLARTLGTLAFAPLRLLLLSSVRIRVPEAPHLVRAEARPTPRIHGVLLAHTLSRRGPPARVFTRATAPGRTTAA